MAFTPGWLLVSARTVHRQREGWRGALRAEAGGGQGLKWLINSKPILKGLQKKLMERQSP